MSLMDDISSDFAAALESSGASRGPVAVTCTIEHALLPEHLQKYLDQHGKLTTTQKAAEKDIRTLRAEHHSIARLLAEGVPEGVVAELTGYTATHISTLKQAPSMIELIEHYRTGPNAAAKLIGEQLKMAAGMSLEVLIDKLRSDELDANQLLQLAKLGFDRSGHGPSSTVHKVDEHRIVAPEELLALGREARRREQQRMVPVEVVRENLLPPPSQESEDE